MLITADAIIDSPFQQRLVCIKDFILAIATSTDLFTKH